MASFTKSIRMPNAFLTQLAFAIKHLPPTIPPEEQAKIEARFGELEALGDEVPDSEVASAMIDIGEIEWPYRLAYKELVMMCCSHTQHDLFLESLSPKTRKKVVAMGGEDMTVPELVHSTMFEEQLSPEERYEVQEAALTARLKMHEYMEEQINARPNDYAKALQKAREEQVRITEAISQLEALASVDPDWEPEITGKVEQFKMGWSIAEPDVTVEDVEREVAYWQETLATSEEEEGVFGE